MNYNLLITICGIIFCHYFYPQESKYLTQPFTIISLIILISIQNKFNKKRHYYQLVLLVLLWFTLIYDVKIAILIIIILLIDILTSSSQTKYFEGFTNTPNYNEDPNFKSSKTKKKKETENFKEDESDTEEEERDEEEESEEEESDEESLNKNLDLGNIKLKSKSKTKTKSKKNNKESFEQVSDRKITIMGEIRRILDDFDSGKNSLTAGEALLDISDVLHEQRKEEFDDIVNGYADQEDDEEMYL